MKPILIVVAGGSASGKTTVVNKIHKVLGNEDLLVIKHDDYYLDNGVCKLCSLKDNCDVCSQTENKCDVCKYDYYPNGDNCTHCDAINCEECNSRNGECSLCKSEDFAIRTCGAKFTSTHSLNV